MGRHGWIIRMSHRQLASAKCKEPSPFPRSFAVVGQNTPGIVEEWRGRACDCGYLDGWLVWLRTQMSTFSPTKTNPPWHFNDPRGNGPNAHTLGRIKQHSSLNLLEMWKWFLCLTVYSGGVDNSFPSKHKSYPFFQCLTQPKAGQHLHFCKITDI